MNRKEVAKRFAAMLLAINALKINVKKPYKWASGWRSPVYCNNRDIWSYPQERNAVKDDLALLIKKSFPDVEVIAGVATAGMPPGVLVADLLNLPFIYVRSKPKEHGLGNMIEGVSPKGKKVVVIEDLVSTGKSSLQVVEALCAAGAEVIGMAALFTYGFPESIDAFAKAGVKMEALSDYETLMEVAEEKQLIAGDDKPTLEEWRLSPSTWRQEEEVK